MQPEQLKRWQWAIVGLLLGLCFSLWRGWNGAEGTLISRSTLDPTEFEQMLARKSAAGQPLLRNISYHSREGGIDWLTAERLVRKGKQPERYLPVKIAFERPYTPRVKTPPKTGTAVSVPAAGGGETLTVVDYLHSAHAKNPDIRFSTRWWDQEPARSPLCAVIGMALMAGVCPAVLAFLGGGGAMPTVHAKRPDAYDLSRFGKGRPEPAKAAAKQDAAHAAAAAQAHLRELEAELERTLTGNAVAPPSAKGATAGGKAASSSAAVSPNSAAAPVAPASPTPTAAPAVRKLDAAPLDATPVMDVKPKHPKRYGGEFYPTETHVNPDEKP